MSQKMYIANKNMKSHQTLLVIGKTSIKEHSEILLFITHQQNLRNLMEPWFGEDMGLLHIAGKSLK